MQNFTLLEKIGSGSYSTVYRARDNRTQQIVALKIMKFAYSKGKRLQDMELAALKKFRQNPCVIQLLEHFMDGDVMCMIFELGGSTLIDYYRRHEGKFSEEEVKVIAYQIAYALQDMHRSGYMHRDLKPENIMIDPETSTSLCYAELVKLVDFGLCKKWETDVNTNYVTTRWYRSPELILNLPYGLNIDVFSLGCVMLELYLGYEAFPGKDAIDQLNKVFSVIGTPTAEEWPEGMKHLEEKRIVFPTYEPTDLHSHIAAISDQGIDLIEKMIACNPKDRISSKQVLEHPYFKDFDVALLPESVQKCIKQIRPPVIQYPLKLNVPPTNDKLKSGSTDTSTSRKVAPTKKKLQLVSNSIQRRLNIHSDKEIPEALNIRINGEPEALRRPSDQPPTNKSFSNFGAGSQLLHSQSTRAKKKLNLTLLEQFNTITSVRNNTIGNIHFSEVEEESFKRQKSQSREETNDRHRLYKFLIDFDKGTRLGDPGHSQSFAH